MFCVKDQVGVPRESLLLSLVSLWDLGLRSFSCDRLDSGNCCSFLRVDGSGDGCGDGRGDGRGVTLYNSPKVKGNKPLDEIVTSPNLIAAPGSLASRGGVSNVLEF